MPTPDELRAAADDVTWWAEMANDDNRPGVLDSAVMLRDAYLAANPVDDGEAVTAEWLLSVGGEKIEDTHKPFDAAGACGTWPKVRYGPLIWYTNLWGSNGDGTYTATYFLKYAGACLGSGPDFTRSQFRHLCVALGIPTPADG